MKKVPYLKVKIAKAEKEIEKLCKSLRNINAVPSKINKKPQSRDSCIGFDNKKYWDSRYQNGGNSGNGSYGVLAEFKAEFINNFIENKRIQSVIDMGCGDGNQLSLLNISEYIGVDISPIIIQNCKEKYGCDKSKTFFALDEFKNKSYVADLSISMDVVFHLVEDKSFEEYLNQLFSCASKFCIIYSSNEPWRVDKSLHVKHRKFTDWIAFKISGWRLSAIHFNKYPHDGTDNPKNSSFSDFYVYEKI